MNKRLLIVSSVIFAFALYANTHSWHREASLERSLSNLPLHFSGWEGRPLTLDAAIAAKLGVSEYVLRKYRRGQQSVLLYLGYYGLQKEEGQIHSPKHCLPGGGWRNVSGGVREMEIEGVGRIRYVEAVYENGEMKEVFSYFYKTRGSYISNEYMLKLSMAWNSIRYRRNDAVFMRFSSPVGGSLEKAAGANEDFMRDFLPLVEEYFTE